VQKNIFSRDKVCSHNSVIKKESIGVRLFIIVGIGFYFILLALLHDKV